MSLIVGQYYRGDPKQKPKQWGPASTVSSTLATRIEDIFDIPYINCTCIVPFWENAGSLIHSYGSLTGAGYNGILRTNSLLGHWDDIGFSKNNTDNLRLSIDSQFIPTSYPFSVVWKAEGNSSTSSTNMISFSDFSGNANSFFFRENSDHSVLCAEYGASAFAAANSIGITTPGLTYQGCGVIEGQSNRTIYLNDTSGINNTTDSGGVVFGNIDTGNIGALSRNGDTFSSIQELSRFQELFIFDIALTQKQIAQLYHESVLLFQRPTFCTYFDLVEGAITGNISETLSASDINTSKAQFVSSISELAGASDSNGGVNDFVVNINEIPNITEVVESTLSLVTSISESIGTTDVYSSLIGVFGAISESLNTSDIFTSTSTLNPSIEDNISAVDTLSYLLTLQAIISENASLQDTVVGTLAGDIAAFISEQANTFDSTVTIADLVSNILENINYQDTTSTAASFLSVIVESFSIQDATNFITGLIGVMDESVGISESFISTFITIAEMSESCFIQDLTGVTANFNVSVSDAVSLVDIISKIAIFNVSLQETFSSQDVIQEVSQLPDGKVRITFSIKTTTINFNIT